MNLNCPKCGGEQTKKLSLVMAEGGMAEKGARLGAAYVTNIWIPVATVIGAIAFGIVLRWSTDIWDFWFLLGPFLL